MSYILDALRRAQAERGRSGVPGLHTPTSLTGTASARAAPHSGWGGAWALGALVLAAGLAALAAWLWRAPAAPAAVALAPAPVPASASAVAAAPMPQAVAPVAASGASAPAAPVRAPRTERRAPAPASAAPPPAPADASTAPTAPAAAPVFAQGDLPPAVREQLPTLQVAGVTYSANPQMRMAIVNGQVLHEGETAAPGLVLERIEQGRTVWAFQGYRYALP